MNRTRGFPVAAISSALTWNGSSRSIRSPHVSIGSPIETHTSVCTKSTPRDRLERVVGDRDPCARLRREVPAQRHVLLARPQLAGCPDPHVHPELGAHQQQRVGHVVAAVADERVGDLVQRLVGVLGHREHVGQHLRRVELVGQPVEHRHPGVLRERLDVLLGRPAVLDRVVHPAEHAGGVLHRLLVPDLRRRRVDVGDVGALVVRRDLEGAARPGRGLLEDQRDVLAAQTLLLHAGVLGPLQVAGRGRAGSAGPARSGVPG